MAVCPKVAFEKLSKTINISYYVGRGCAEAIRDACIESADKTSGVEKTTFKPAEKPKVKPKAK